MDGLDDLEALFGIELEEVTTVGGALAALLFALEPQRERDRDLRALYEALERLQSVADPFSGHPAGALLRGFRMIGERSRKGGRARKLGTMARVLSERVGAEATLEEVLALWATVTHVLQHKAQSALSPGERRGDWQASAFVWQEGLGLLTAAQQCLQ